MWVSNAGKSTAKSGQWQGCEHDEQDGQAGRSRARCRGVRVRGKAMAAYAMSSISGGSTIRNWRVGYRRESMGTPKHSKRKRPTPQIAATSHSGQKTTDHVALRR